MTKDKIIRNDSVGIVQAQTFTFDALKLENGEKPRACPKCNSKLWDKEEVLHKQGRYSVYQGNG